MAFGSGAEFPDPDALMLIMMMKTKIGRSPRRRQKLRKTEVAEIFDKKLVDEVSRFGIIVVGEKTGWVGGTHIEWLSGGYKRHAVLPLDHPVVVEYVKRLFASY